MMQPLRSGLRFRGPIKAVVFDWAGTVLDYGSLAPVHAIMRVFGSRGLPLTEAEARGPMGMSKRDHLTELVALEHVRERWRTLYGESPGSKAVDALYSEFRDALKGILAEHSQLI